MAGGHKKEVEDKKKKNVVDHPTTSEMVLNAVRTLKDRSGSSLYAIKKYIGENYQFDPTKQATLVNKTIKKLVENGSLSQVKGSFKMGTAAKEQASKKKSVKKEVTKTKSAPKKSVKVKLPKAKTVQSSPKMRAGRKAAPKKK